MIGIENSPRSVSRATHGGQETTMREAGSATERIQQEISDLGSNIDGLFLKASIIPVSNCAPFSTQAESHLMHTT